LRGPELRKKILARLGDAAGERTRNADPGWLSFEAQIGGATVRTLISIKGRGADLSYFQEVLDGGGARLQTCISALSLLGITGGPTAWEKVGQENVDQSLSALRVGCGEFLAAVPGLLAAT